MILAAALAALTGCGMGSSQVSLSARVGKPATAQGAGQLRQGLEVSTGLDISRIRVVVRELELEAAAGTVLPGSSDDDDGGFDDSGSDDSRVEIEQGPFLIDLSDDALSGQAVKLVDAVVPAGTYREIEFKVQKLMGAERNDARFADMAAADASIIVDGTIDGAPFQFVSSLDEEQELEGNIVLDGTDNITLNLDPSGWFTGASGRLDPRVASNRSTIEANIKRSIDVFDDDDHDGFDDSRHDGLENETETEHGPEHEAPHDEVEND